MSMYALALFLLLFWQHKCVVSNQKTGNLNENLVFCCKTLNFDQNTCYFYDFKILVFLHISFEILGVKYFEHNT